jgi:hypothetical protein
MKGYIRLPSGYEMNGIISKYISDDVQIINAVSCYINTLILLLIPFLSHSGDYSAELVEVPSLCLEYFGTII